MSIRIEMLTVVTKEEVIQEKYPGGLHEYLEMPFVWHDAELVGSSFMNGLDVELHVKYLVKCGICLDDIAIVDQIHGILTDSDWLEYGKTSGEEPSCCLKGEMPYNKQRQPS